MAQHGDTVAEGRTSGVAAPPPAAVSWREQWARCWQRNGQLQEENATLRSTITFLEHTIAELKEDVAAMAPVVNRRSVKLLRRVDFLLRMFVRRGLRDERSSNRSVPSAQGSPTAGDAVRRYEAPADTISYEPADRFAATAPIHGDEVPSTSATSRRNPATAADEEAIRLIVLSPVPRSGSTLLQRICNARKGTLIWGEHNAVLSHFTGIYGSVQSLECAGKKQREDFFASGEDPNLWTANVCPDQEYLEQAVVESARAMLNTLYSQYRQSHDVVGFKEVRYGMEEAALLRKCYPAAKMLLLVRHPCHTWSSTPRQWYPRLDEWIALWNRNAEAFLVLDASDENCHLIRYEDLVGRDPATLQVIAETAEVTNEQILDVLACKLGSRRHGTSDAERETICQECQRVMAMLGYP